MLHSPGRPAVSREMNQSHSSWLFPKAALSRSWLVMVPSESLSESATDADADTTGSPSRRSAGAMTLLEGGQEVK